LTTGSAILGLGGACFFLNNPNIPLTTPVFFVSSTTVCEIWSGYYEETGMFLVF
jgi:hypothetical protein